MKHIRSEPAAPATTQADQPADEIRFSMLGIASRAAGYHAPISRLSERFSQYTKIFLVCGSSNRSVARWSAI
ncbi:hypothetical protein [Nitrosomonas communis]|uniref:hypothetical protein n=1 Tax=Nitrosomonas communis TaxID=44574 RepID=UPI001160430A|nr:hypothetical protein [Nitrosomonas communis]